MQRPILLATSIVALLALASGDTDAATTSRMTTASAPALCQPALPAYDGRIRKRPLAVQNESSTNAFVSCALIGDGNSLGGTQQIFVYLINLNDAPASITCTLVNSHAGDVFLSVTKTREVPANDPGGATGLHWLPVDNGGNPFSRWTSLSCNLPAGTGIGHLGSVQQAEIGA
ncbi:MULTISPECIES: hypothetical protein [unclassified Luteimonas]